MKKIIHMDVLGRGEWVVDKVSFKSWSYLTKEMKKNKVGVCVMYDSMDV